jgi:hypothetical protein
MKFVARLSLIACTLAASAQAEVPVYRNQQLDVPSAVVLTGQGPVYYGDVRFTANPDGSFALTEAKRRKLALVDSATVTVDAATAQAEVAARGELTIACVALEEPAVVRDGHTFHVVLAETPLDPLALCMPFVAVTRFDVEVPLDLRGLDAGAYVVNVNGVIKNFVLSGN